MEDNDLFGVEDPETGEVGYCSVMGQLGEVFALGVFPGPEGLEGYHRLAEGELKPEDPEATVAQRCLLASFEERISLDQRDLAVIRALGLRLRGHNAWPQFRSQWPGFAPWNLTAPEARFLASALEQALDVALRVRDGLDLFERVDDNLVLVREWDRAKQTWRDSWQPLPPPPAPPPIAGFFDEARLRRVKQATDKTAGAWQVDLFYIPAIVEEPGRRPYYPRMWLCVEPRSGLVVGTAILEPWKSPADFQGAFLDILEGAQLLPAEVLVARRELRELLAPLAQGLGITVREQRRLAALEKTRKSLASFMQR